MQQFFRPFLFLLDAVSAYLTAHPHLLIILATLVQILFVMTFYFLIETIRTGIILSKEPASLYREGVLKRHKRHKNQMWLFFTSAVLLTEAVVHGRYGSVGALLIFHWAADTFFVIAISSNSFFIRPVTKSEWLPARITAASYSLHYRTGALSKWFFLASYISGSVFWIPLYIKLWC